MEALERSFGGNAIRQRNVSVIERLKEESELSETLWLDAEHSSV